MKKFLSIYGIILFFFVSCLLMSESPGSGDTSLYFLNGSSVGLQYFDNLYNLSPFVMQSIYVIVLIGIILSIKYKKNYAAITIGNLILSIPIFLVHKDTLFFRPFYYAHSNLLSCDIVVWTWYIYFSVLGAIMLSIYLFVKNKKYTSRQRISIKKFMKFFLILVSVILCINITKSIYLSFKIDSIIKASYNSYGKINTFPDNISDKNFRFMNYRGSRHKDYNKSYEKNWHSFPITLSFFNHAQSYYWYDYESSFNGAKTDLYFPVIISMELENFIWVINDVRDLP